MKKGVGTKNRHSRSQEGMNNGSSRVAVGNVILLVCCCVVQVENDTGLQRGTHNHIEKRVMSMTDDSKPVENIILPVSVSVAGGAPCDSPGDCRCAE